jgi:hypothetical protein
MRGRLLRHPNFGWPGQAAILFTLLRNGEREIAEVYARDDDALLGKGAALIFGAQDGNSQGRRRPL